MGSSGGFTDARFSGVGTRAAITGLSPDTTYEVQVRAVNDEGAGPWSASGRGETKPTPNRPPVFTEGGGSINRWVPENTPAGEPIGTPVSATDADANDVLGYSLGAADATAFDIDSATGQIKTRAALNYEARSTYFVTVTVNDGVLTASIAATIRVTDVDGEAPGALVAPTVVARGADRETMLEVSWARPANAGPPIWDYSIQYRVEGSGEFIPASFLGVGGRFTITGLSPGATYEVQIRAVNDEGTGPWSASGQGTTQAPDAPVFTEGDGPINRSIPENTVAGEPIGAPVSATDADANDVLGYSLGGADATAFDIDSATGQIKTRAALNYEARSSYFVTVTVNDGVLTASIAATIRVTDVDGEAPAAPAAPTVAAGATDGETTLDVKWEAPVNTGPPIENYSIRYRAGSSGEFSPVRFSGVGLGATIKELSPGATYEVQIRAVNEEGTSPWSASGQGETRPTPNRPPVFTEGDGPINRSIPENTAAGGPIGGRVSATDADSNDVLSYGLGGAYATAFDIDSATGQIKTRAALNYEARSTYLVTVTVSDGVLTAGIAVRIRVTNVYGEAPAVPAAPTVVAGATDGETTLDVKWEAPVNTGPPIENYNIRYRAGSSGEFSPVRFSGVGLGATIKELSPSTMYEVQVKAVNDEGASPWSASGQGTTAIPGAPARPTGLTATAGDREVTLSWNDPMDAAITKWQYSIRGDNGRYDEWSDVPNSNTSTTSYRVTGLDNRKGYAFSVRAVNIAGPGLAAAIVANTAPVFPGAQNGATDRNVAENAGAGEAVGSPVVATDANGDALTYALGGPDAASFAIDEDTGQIRVGAGTTLDYETKSSYAVEVAAADPSDAGATIAVTITVNNVDLPGGGNDYDADGNEEIDRDEAIAALADYFGGAISREQAIAVILLYFAG